MTVTKWHRAQAPGFGGKLLFLSLWFCREWLHHHRDPLGPSAAPVSIHYLHKKQFSSFSKIKQLLRKGSVSVEKKTEYFTSILFWERNITKWWLLSVPYAQEHHSRCRTSRFNQKKKAEALHFML